jgi:ribonuclease G
VLIVAYELLIEAVGNETRIVLSKNGSPTELIIENLDRESLVGNIYVGKVEAYSKALGAAFIDIGEAKAGFLAVKAKPFPVEGQSLLVQVSRDGYRSKGPQVSQDLSIAGRFLVYSPFRPGVSISKKINNETEKERLVEILAGLVSGEEGLIARTAAEHISHEILSNELNLLKKNWENISILAAERKAPALIRRDLNPVPKVLRDQPLPELSAIIINGLQAFSEASDWCKAFAPELLQRMSLYRGHISLFDTKGCNDVFDSVTGRFVGLPSGGALVIDRTEALTVIDVNSGGYLRGSTPRDNAYSVNLEAAEEICHQIRLRNIGGMILIDFISLEDEKAWAEILETIGRHLAKESGFARCLGKTNGGLVEIVRRRSRPEISEYLVEACHSCDGSGLQKTTDAAVFSLLTQLRQTSAAAPMGSILIVVSPEISDSLEKSYGTGAALAAAIGIGRIIEWRSDPDLTGNRYQVSLSENKLLENKDEF